MRVRAAASPKASAEPRGGEGRRGEGGERTGDAESLGRSAPQVKHAFRFARLWPLHPGAVHRQDLPAAPPDLAREPAIACFYFESMFVCALKLARGSRAYVLLLLVYCSAE
jgi:hypothetical protein